MSTLYHFLSGEVGPSSMGAIDKSALTGLQPIFQIPDMYEFWDSRFFTVAFGSNLQTTGGNAQWTGLKRGLVLSPFNDTGPWLKANAWNSMPSAHLTTPTGRNGEVWSPPADGFLNPGGAVTVGYVGRSQGGVPAAMIGSGHDTNYFCIRMNAGNTVSASLQQTGGGIILGPTSASYDPLVAPHLCVLSVDPVSATANLYINGILVDTAAGITAFVLAGESAHFGATGDGNATVGQTAQELSHRGEYQAIFSIRRALHRTENASHLAALHAAYMDIYGL